MSAVNLSTEPARALLASLAAHGLEVKVEGGKLLFRPRGILSPRLATQIRQHMPALLRLLQPEAGMGPLCPACSKRRLDEKGRCWGKGCYYRRCQRCGWSTGSPFIALCVGCGNKDLDSQPQEVVNP